MSQSLIIVLLLAACLVALLLVQFARKEAAAERDSARRESTSLREEAKLFIADAQRREERVAAREKEIAADQRAAGEYARTIEDRSTKLSERERQIDAEESDLRSRGEAALAALAGLSASDAKAELLKRLTVEAESEAEGAIRRAERRAIDESDAKAKKVLVDALQRHAGESTTQQTVTWISLPSEEMKGRIIGREGRNIRAFEALTGVNVIVEEGTTAVMLSSFDVERRDIAEVALNALIADGRIQPHRIEAAYADAVASADERHKAAALDAIEAAGVVGLAPGLLEPLGRLRLRTSYGQNVLAHLVESAHIAAEIARETGADVAIARRAAFLHDLGKAWGTERDGTHAAIGAEEAARNGESETVVNAIAAHHDEVEPESIEAVIVQIADTVSASRPGARRGELDGYVERLETLERLVAEVKGVADVVVVSAGREVRVVVSPEEVPDIALTGLARSIADLIRRDGKTPGEVKVTVIREVRAEAVAG